MLGWNTREIAAIHVHTRFGFATTPTGKETRVMNFPTTSQMARLAMAGFLAAAFGCQSSKSESAAPTAIQAASTDSGMSNVEPANVQVTVKRGESANGTPTLVATKVVTLQVRIENIDYDTRGIVLTGPDGNQEIFTVGPEVVNFDQLHKGDLVNCKFTMKMAASVVKASDIAAAPEATETGEIALPPIGSTPGIVATRAGTFTANVVAIDQSSREVTVTGPRGNTVVIQVAPQAEGLDKVQVGDQVVVGYSEAVEIFVTGS
jgi:hypothetical protein